MESTHPAGSKGVLACPSPRRPGICHSMVAASKQKTGEVG